MWAAVRKGRERIGPLFLEDEHEESITVITKTYMDVALKPFWKTVGKRKGIEREKEWSQQDSVTPHIYATSPHTYATQVSVRFVSLGATTHSRKAHQQQNGHSLDSPSSGSNSTGFYDLRIFAEQ